MSNETNALGAAVLEITEAIRAVCSDPADAVRLLSRLATYTVATSGTTAPIGAAIATVQSAASALCRRAALVSLAKACAEYNPASYEDAAALRTAVSALFDAEILNAGSGSEGQAYLALRRLQAAVIEDLSERGGKASRLRTVTSTEPLPSLVLAYQLYDDATRADELAIRTGAPHPGFMPREFRALAG
ncbi:hypothetical protein [Roseomonas chloroacetimidivorans]|uniref:hypothetical protein n=1 Tax=Roseomonas chloroacetimidivorans TaxID=1766656 RepID=UPI003C743CA6